MVRGRYYPDNPGYTYFRNPDQEKAKLLIMAGWNRRTIAIESDLSIQKIEKIAKEINYRHIGGVYEKIDPWLINEKSGNK